MKDIYSQLSDEEEEGDDSDGQEGPEREKNKG